MEKSSDGIRAGGKGNPEGVTKNRRKIEKVEGSGVRRGRQEKRLKSLSGGVRKRSSLLNVYVLGSNNEIVGTFGGSRVIDHTENMA